LKIFQLFIIRPAMSPVACVAGPQFYGGPDLQRAGFWRANQAPHKIEACNQKSLLMAHARISYSYPVRSAAYFPERKLPLETLRLDQVELRP
jgi:hypothetical protein